MAENGGKECSSCLEFGSKYYCFKCRRFHCDSCLKDGDIRGLHTLEYLSITCADHVVADNMCKHFCEICDKPVCQSCILKHIGEQHSLIRLEDAIEKKIKAIDHQKMMIFSELEKRRKELKGLVKNKDISCDDFCKAVERKLLMKVRESILSMNETAKKHLVNSPEKIERKKQQISSAIEEMQTTLYEFDSYTCGDILEFTDDNYKTNFYGKDFTSFPALEDIVQRIVSETQAKLEDGIRKAFQETYNDFFPERVDRGNQTIKTMQMREVNIGVDFLMDIVCASKDVMICSAQNNCSLFRIESGMKSVMPCTGFNPEYISMSPSSDIILFTSLNEVFELSIENMEIVELFKLDSEWEINGLTFASNDRIYLCSREKTFGRGWIFCLNKYGKVVDEYSVNNDGYALLVNPIYISENKNNDGDICVSDNYSEVCSIKQNKEIRFVYKGVENMTLDIRGIVSDVLGNILVSDFKNNLIHVINKGGKLIRKIGEDFLCKPTGICITSQGVIWVTEYEGGKVKMIET